MHAPAPWAAAIERLQDTLGFRFRRLELLRTALTHATYVHEHPEVGEDYERLEFVGDAVLALVCAARLYVALPGAREGVLSQRRARAVRRDSLAELAKELHLGQAMRLGLSADMQEGQENPRLLADVFEAVVGAIFIDGGYHAVAAVVAPLIERALDRSEALADYKTLLQEACHARGLPSPVYRVVRAEGPDHARHFVCAVSIDEVVCGEGAGNAKKSAEQRCAQLALKAIEQPEEPVT